jgi:hypothetical protein
VGLSVIPRVRYSTARRLLATVQARNERGQRNADVLNSKSGNAAVADQRNKMGRNLTGDRDMYPDRDYVTECRDAKRMRQVWAIPVAIVGGALLLGAVLERRRDRGSTS